jgi:ubiquinone/menaquinone biosynthesis C-methylase UbiE
MAWRPMIRPIMATGDESANQNRNPAGDTHQRVRAQFGAAAHAYTTSAGHGDPAMLARVVEFARPRPGDLALDIATGAGHTALALAPHVARVVAYDLTPQMLEETRLNARARGLHNVETRQGAAEALPFVDASFDIVTVRQAPHHFADIRRAVGEMARVVRPGGRVVVVDSTSPEDDELDRQYNQIEKLRDPSHVRNYRRSEWRAMMEEAGLRIEDLVLDYYLEQGRPMDFAAWTARMKTPPAAVEELRRLFRGASPELRAALKIEIAGDAIGFYVPQITIVAVRG